MPKYDLQWLTDRFNNGDNLEYLFFWGHTNVNEEIGASCFSQWFELPFIVDGITYKTTEHWMMANKAMLFEDTITYNKIISTNNPREAKELGRQVMGFDDLIWDANRLEIVVNGNIHKFNQNSKHAEYLINTKDKILVEASPVDIIWGIGLAKDNEDISNPYLWRGQNLLGFSLMNVRDFINLFGHFKNLENVTDLPWKAFPKIDPMDLFWRMGVGEDLIITFSRYYESLSARDKVIFKLTNPVPYSWKKFLCQ